jgi:hypothetical protein
MMRIVSEPCRRRSVAVNHGAIPLQQPFTPERKMAAIADDEMVMQHDA